jgi:tRNA G46 methylase TrmB
MENNQNQQAAAQQQAAQETTVETQNKDFEPVGNKNEETSATGKSVKQWAMEHAVEIGIGVGSFLIGVFTGRATKSSKKD